jgi:replicative DNA helicase
MSNPTDDSRPIERALLGSILRSPELFGEVADVVQIGDFGTAHHQMIFGAMQSAVERRLVPTAVIVMDELVRSKNTDVSAVDVAEILNDGGTAATVPSLISRLQAHALQRNLRYAVVDMARDVESPDVAPEELLDRSQARLDRLSARSSSGQSKTVAETLAAVSDEMDQIERGEVSPGLLTGFAGLDETLGGGLPIGQTTIIGARPSVGKTSLAMHIARNVCSRGGAVSFFSLEQRANELTYRILAAEARIPMRTLRSAGKSQRDMQTLGEAMERKSQWRMRINDCASLTAMDIAAGARYDRRKLNGLDLVVIDYLQLITPRNEQVGVSARRIANMARDLNVPVLLLCQLNRAATDQDKPALHHLRDSGETEQVADVVLFLHRSELQQPKQRDKIDLIVAKQRNGALAMRQMEHEGWFFTFHETAEGIPGIP